MSKINIRESLNRLDLQTDNKYDLLNTFNSKKLSDNSKKKLAEAIENNSMASVNRILHESEEQLYKVVISSGATKRNFESALYEDEAEEIVDYYGGRWIDENGFEWDMYVEEDDDSTEHAMVDNSYDMEDDDERAQREYVESLNEAINAKDSMVAQEFNYTMQYGDQSSDVNAAVIIIPGGLKIDGNPSDLVVYAEDENGKVINFKSVEEANDWINKYKDDVEFHIEQGNELHATPSAYYYSFDESLNDEVLYENDKFKIIYDGKFYNLIGKEDNEIYASYYNLDDAKDDAIKDPFYESLTEAIKDVNSLHSKIWNMDNNEKICFPNGYCVKCEFYDREGKAKRYIVTDKEDNVVIKGKFGFAWQPQIKKFEKDFFNLLNGRSVDESLDNDVLKYDDEMSDTWADMFDIASPKEVANTFGKNVKSKNKIYRPSKNESFDIENLMRKVDEYLFYNKDAERPKGYIGKNDRGYSDLLNRYGDYFTTSFRYVKVDDLIDYAKKHGIINESLTEADYGGAYDIENDMFFTKEDIVEFAEEICEYLGDIFGYQYDINNVYMDGPKKLYINIYDNNYIEVESTFDIDMRKIRKPSDLSKVYGLTIENWFQKAFAREYRDAGLDESLTEAKKVGSNKISQGMNLPGKNFELIKITDGIVSSKDRYECRIYSKELDSNKDYGFYQGEVIFDDDDPQLIDSVFPDEGTKVKLAIYKVPEDDPDHDWTGDYFVDYIDETNESLKEDIEDEEDFEYDDSDDVEEGVYFFADGENYAWVERIAGPIHLDFDNWAVWSAKEIVPIQDFIIGKNEQGGYDVDRDAYITAINSKPIVYFVVDEDTGFIDWGPVETSTEAQDFLNGKVEDYKNDEEYEEVEIEEESLHEKKEDNIRYFPKLTAKETSFFHKEGDWDILGKENSIYHVNIIACDKYDRDGKRKTKAIEDNDKEFLRKYGYTTEKSARNSVRSLEDDFDIEIIKVDLDNLQESLNESINQNDVFKFLDEIKDTVSSFKNRVQEVSEYFDISEDEAEDFVYDWEQENSLTESKAIKNDDDFEVTLHYNDIGNGKEYDYKLGYDEVVDYLREIAWSNGDGPEDASEDEYLEWVMDNFDELADKYELNVLDYFEDEASQYEYDHRNDEP